MTKTIHVPVRVVITDIYVYKSWAMEGLNWGHERTDAIITKGNKTIK